MNATQTIINRGAQGPRVADAPVISIISVPCTACYGTGRSMSEPKRCPICQGRGRKEIMEAKPMAAPDLLSFNI